MELALVCPVAHIACSSLLTGRFCIAPVAIRHSTYYGYFREASRAGYDVILDNGVFENERVASNNYIELVKGIKPKIVILPDTINAPAEENWSAAQNFLTALNMYGVRGDLPDLEFMFVPQCVKGDTEGFWKVLERVYAYAGIQWIGICRDAVYNAFGTWTGTTDQELNRFYFATELQKRFKVKWIMKKKWHFLGMGKRLDLLPYFWFVDAMDTASLFFQATQGNIVTSEFILPGKLRRPKDYFVRDFSTFTTYDWSDTLSINCSMALQMAQAADTVRQRILGSRL